MICGICEGEYQPTDADVDDAIAGVTDHACPNCRRIVNMVRDEATRRAEAARDADDLVWVKCDVCGELFEEPRLQFEAEERFSENHICPYDGGDLPPDDECMPPLD